MHFWPFNATLTELPIAFRKGVWFPASSTTTTTASVVHVISERETENHFTSNFERDVERL